jgi:hypothetical protein
MILFIVLGPLIAWMIFLIGWLVGFNNRYDAANWGIGFDDGWKAHEMAMAVDISKQYGAEEEEE